MGFTPQFFAPQVLMQTPQWQTKAATFRMVSGTLVELEEWFALLVNVYSWQLEMAMYSRFTY